jgi:hypothetical protein
LHHYLWITVSETVSEFSPFEAVKSSEVASLPLETVSETVSESGERVVKNCGELKQILLETQINSAIFECLKM